MVHVYPIPDAENSQHAKYVQGLFLFLEILQKTHTQNEIIISMNRIIRKIVVNRLECKWKCSTHLVAI